MKPKADLITISDNEQRIKQMLMDLVIEPRIKALEWSKITKQTPNMKVGYPGQHLASLVLGMEGSRTGARGHDIVDKSEVKSCSRVDQLDNCHDCGEKVLRIETLCPSCGSARIKRMNDSKWLFTIRSDKDLETLTDEVERVVLTIADYPGFETGKFDDLRFQVFEIWTKSPRCKHFKTLMTKYFHSIYQAHRQKNADKTPAPKNFWPYSYQFYLCNPIRVFACTVRDANASPNILIEQLVMPNTDRNLLPSVMMPTELLYPQEIVFLADLPDSQLAPLISGGFSVGDFRKEISQSKPDKRMLAGLLPSISEELRSVLPLRDTDKIAEAKQPYRRK